MIKVIKEGQKKFVAVCSRCGCTYSYEVEDITCDYVTCPDCGYIYAWKHSTRRELSLGTEDGIEHALQKRLNWEHTAHMLNQIALSMFLLIMAEQSPFKEY